MSHLCDFFLLVSVQIVITVPGYTGVQPRIESERLQGAKEFSGHRRGDGNMKRADELARENAALRERLSRLSEASHRINESLDFSTVLAGVLGKRLCVNGSQVRCDHSPRRLGAGAGHSRPRHNLRKSEINVEFAPKLEVSRIPWQNLRAGASQRFRKLCQGVGILRTPPPAYG